MDPSQIPTETINSYRRAKRIYKEIAIQTEEDFEVILQHYEKDLNKLRVENIKLTNALKQIQDNLALYSANQNNTSSGFMLPSEFKSKWEHMVKEALPNLFISLCEQPMLLVYAVQSSCLFIESKFKAQVQSTIQKVSDLLGVDNNLLRPYMVKIMQDHNQNCLNFNESIVQEYQEWIGQELSNLIDQFITVENQQDQHSLVQEWIQQLDIQDISAWASIFWKLIGYINLSDQELSLGFDNVDIQFVDFKKNDYYLVDGFGKEGSPSIVLLPFIKREKHHIYHAIKPAVLILPPKYQDIKKPLNQIEPIILNTDSVKSIKISPQKPIEKVLTLEDLRDSIKSSRKEIQFLEQSYNEPVEEQDQSINRLSKSKQIQDVKECKTFLSQRSSQNSIAYKKPPIDDQVEYRIKPQQQPRRSLIQEMKDTIQMINKLESSQSIEGQKKLDLSMSKDSDRYYMQRIMRTQNSRIEENSSFIGKVNNQLAGKIVHQKSLHKRDPQLSLQLQNARISQHQAQLITSNPIKGVKNKQSCNKENVNNPQTLSIAQLMQKLNKNENSQNPLQNTDKEQRSSLEKLMKSFCLSQRNQGFKEWQHKRAQSNEQKSNSSQNQNFKKILDNLSSEEDDQGSFLRDAIIKNKKLILSKVNENSTNFNNKNNKTLENTRQQPLQCKNNLASKYNIIENKRQI